MSEGQPALPRIFTMGCRATRPGESWEWHTHDFDEVCMFTGDTCTAGHCGKVVKGSPDTLFLARRGERHGFWNSASEAPDLWVVHYKVDEGFYNDLQGLVTPKPEERIWRLTPLQATKVKSLFAKISVEAGRTSPEAATLSSAWLQILLACLQRWKSSLPEESFILHELEPDILELWKTVNDLVPQPFSSIDRLTEMVEGYDSLRHRFKRVFGQSPRGMMQTLRMQRAQHLLMEGQKSVKEVAVEVGYLRQHEFSRAFRKAFGVSPSDWREHPRFYVDKVRHTR